MEEAPSLPHLRADALRLNDPTSRGTAWAQVQPALEGPRAFSVEFTRSEVGSRPLDVLLRLFELPEETLWQVARRSIRPDSPFEWVGYGYHRDGTTTLHQTFDLGSWGAAPVADVRPSAWSSAEVTPLPSGLKNGWLLAADELRSTLTQAGRDLIGLIAWGLGRDQSAATSRFRPDGSTLRILNYPVVDGPVSEPLRAAEHEDSGALTFIWSDRPGLQVQTSSGEWVRASPMVWTVICGHVISEMTDGAFSATTHRVVPGHDRRRSLAYFFEPGRDASIVPWPPVGVDDPPSGERQRYGAWLKRRHGG